MSYQNVNEKHVLGKICATDNAINALYYDKPSDIHGNEIKHIYLICSLWDRFIKYLLGGGGGKIETF